MQTMLKMPDDAIAKFQSMLFEERIENGIKWHNFAIRSDVVSNLPADRTFRVHHTNALGDGLRLL
ncbi:hypothetical protein XP1712_09505 [Xanthomonas perforans]|nr:hypothetical protein XP1712_09505 [Xanthomonas perforans]